METPSKVSQGPAPAHSGFYSISIPHLLHTLFLHLVPWAPLFNPGERESAKTDDRSRVGEKGRERGAGTWREDLGAGGRTGKRRTDLRGAET